jgi:nicotinamide-nucleotide amidase
MIRHTLCFAIRNYIMRNFYPLEAIEAAKDILIRKKATIAVAESVTAGHLQAALSQAENARQVFQGGVTVYNIGQKCRLLRVEPIHALEVNGVSQQIAETMATMVIDLFCSHIGIAITGYASPVPEKDIHHPFAWFCVANQNGILKTARLEPPPADPLSTQLFYMETILKALPETLSNF